MASRIDVALVEQVISSTRAVRDLVNIRRRHRAIMKDSSRYSTICSAMDTLGDTSQALRAYAEAKEKAVDDAYLLAYLTLPRNLVE